MGDGTGGGLIIRRVGGASLQLLAAFNTSPSIALELLEFCPEQIEPGNGSLFALKYRKITILGNGKTLGYECYDCPIPSWCIIATDLITVLQ